MSELTTEKHKRVRRRDLKVGKVFVCAFDGRKTVAPHCCMIGEPLVITDIHDLGTKSRGQLVAVSAKYKSYDRATYVHLFRLCDLRHMTREEWGI